MIVDITNQSLGMANMGYGGMDQDGELVILRAKDQQKGLEITQRIHHVSQISQVGIGDYIMAQVDGRILIKV